VSAAPLTTAQERIWFLGQVGDDYHVPMTWRLRGPLDVAALCGALGDAVRRHGALRTRFPVRDGQPVQEVLPEWDLPVELLDASQEEASAVAAARIAAPFDLAAAPPVRATLIRLDAGDHVLCVVAHHLVADDISIGILSAEVAAGYAARLAGGRLDLPPLPVQYAEYAREERAASDAGRVEALRYWAERLAGIRPLDLPTDRPRPATPTTGGGTESLGSAQAAADIRTLSRAGRTTGFMTSLAAYLALLGLYSGQDDIAVGSPVDTRDRTELEPLVGFFLDTVVLRGDLSGDPTMRDLLARVKATLIAAHEHRKAPLEELPARLGLRRDPSRTPLFDTMFVYHGAQGGGLELPGLEVGWFDAGLARAKFDLLVDVLAGRDEVTLIASFRSDLFDGATVALLLRRLEALLRLAAADPDARLSTLYARLAAQEGPAEPACAAPQPQPSVVERIWAQAAATPHAVAVDAPDGRLTYAELVDRADRAATTLRPGTFVEVCREPGAALVVTLLAVLRAGAAYVPLDPDHPERRRAAMRAHGDADGLAYVIHTSGSTGEPKPVAVSHAALATRVAWMAEAYGIGPGDRVLQLSSPGFDTLGEEVYPCLSRGATLVVPPVARAELPDFLASPAGRALTVLDLPTAYWHELVASLPPGAWPDALRLVVIGGEQARADVVQRWFRAFGERVALWNTYGPTEATIIATAARLTPADGAGRPPIGIPIAGTCAHVRDRHGGPVPAGVPGELYLGGPGLASGYLHRPDLDEERFVELDGVRHYRTGDRVRVRPDGALEFLGRLDDQLKVRGHRIEPAEVEGALTAYQGIRDAAVTVDGGRLVGHLVLEPGAAAPGAADLRAHLAGLLPAAFHPEAFAVRDALPLTANGKLDRAALSPVDTAAPERTGSPLAPHTDAERLVAAVWSQVLGVDRIGVDDDFFDLGGHSLLATRVAARLRVRVGLDVPLRVIFRATTVRALAEAVEDLLLAEIEAMDEGEAERLAGKN
jgi:amino acid adenylation domain-containing protein